MQGCVVFHADELLIPCKFCQSSVCSWFWRENDVGRDFNSFQQLAILLWALKRFTAKLQNTRLLIYILSLIYDTFHVPLPYFTSLVLMCLKYIGFVSGVSDMILSLCFKLQKRDRWEICFSAKFTITENVFAARSCQNRILNTFLHNRTLDNQTRVAFCYSPKKWNVTWT